MSKKDHPPLFLVAAENDGRNPLLSEGAIVWETYTRLATLEHAIELAKKLGDQYGRTFILRCEVIGGLEDAEKLLAESEEWDR
jgi:hypothetical protein